MCTFTCRPYSLDSNFDPAVNFHLGGHQCVCRPFGWTLNRRTPSAYTGRWWTLKTPRSPPRREGELSPGLRTNYKFLPPSVKCQNWPAGSLRLGSTTFPGRPHKNLEIIGAIDGVVVVLVVVVVQANNFTYCCIILCFPFRSENPEIGRKTN